MALGVIEMALGELGEPIAEREFVICDADGNESRAVARIGRPHPDQSEEDWVCPYEIVVAGKRKAFRIYGVDSIQALVLALKTVDVELEVRAKQLGGVLMWLGSPHQSVFDAVDRKRDQS